MLSPRDIAEWRARDLAIEARPQPGVWTTYTCLDGPLAGLTMKTRPNIKFAFIESCFLTRTGPVTASYEPTGQPGKLRFRGYGYPGRESRGYDLHQSPTKMSETAE